MPDTSTPNFGFTLPEVGGSTSTWGGKNNTNWSDLDTLLQTLADGLDLAGTVATAALPASSYTAADVLAKLLTVDGPGSALDADTLDGLQAAAFVLASSYTAADVLAKLLTVDGAGSGVDADLLDGQQGAWYADVAGRLGYTPVNKAGDSISGNLSIGGSLTVTGDVTSSSDERLKSDVTDLDGAAMLAALCAIGGKRFIMAGKRRMGVIAQDVEAAGLRELVSTDSDGIKSVSYISMIAPLIAAVAHLAGRVAELEAARDAA